MATSTTGASSQKGGAPGRSKASQNGHLKTIKLTMKPLTGLEIKNCPKTLPPTFTWDGARIQARLSEEDPRVIGDLYRLIESVVGEEGAEEIRKRLIDAKVDPGMDLLADVLNDLTSSYGTGLGESSASPQP